MSARIIVVVSDRDDAKRGEVTVIDNPRKAELLVETLLEAGFERERIHLFSGEQLNMRVSRRPAVALVEEHLEQAAAARGWATRQETALQEALGEAAPPAKEEESVAKPFVRDGVRFSSLFRSA